MQISRPRKINECITDPRHFFRPQLLFDEFWRAGEMALFFGPAGAGKSILAMQIADALSRGSGFDGFRMRTGRQKVLYVDLVLRDEQLQERYSIVPPNYWPLKFYKFPENLYRDRPQSDDDLCGWLRTAVIENGFHAVVIDDLSALSSTHNGTRETFKIMRRLRQIRDELNVSMLVLIDSDEPGRSGVVSEADLGRSRVLCNLADSVFAIGRLWNNADVRYIIQTRSRNAPILWNERNAPRAQIVQAESGMLGFAFDERFAPRISPQELEQIRRVKYLRDRGETYRTVGAELGLSKSRAERLLKKWTPSMGTYVPPDPPRQPEPEPEPAVRSCGAVYISVLKSSLLTKERWQPLWADGVIQPFTTERTEKHGTRRTTEQEDGDELEKK